MISEVVSRPGVANRARNEQAALKGILAWSQSMRLSPLTARERPAEQWMPDLRILLAGGLSLFYYESGEV